MTTYATWNPDDKHPDLTLSGSDLTITCPVTVSWQAARGTVGVSSGKWYWEVVGDYVTSYLQLGIMQSTASLSNHVGFGADGISYYNDNGTAVHNSDQNTYGNTWTTGDVIGVALDMDNGEIWFSKNGVWQDNGNPTTGYNSASDRHGLTLSGIWYPAISLYNANNEMTANFGQSAFTYTVPDGFQAGLFSNDPPTTEFRPLVIDSSGGWLKELGDEETLLGVGGIALKRSDGSTSSVPLT